MRGGSEQLGEDWCAETGGWVPPLLRRVSFRDLAAVTPDRVGALDNVRKRVGVLVDERVEEAELGLALGDERVVDEGNQAREGRPCPPLFRTTSSVLAPFPIFCDTCIRKNAHLLSGGYEYPIINGCVVEKRRMVGVMGQKGGVMGLKAGVKVAYVEAEVPPTDSAFMPCTMTWYPSPSADTSGVARPGTSQGILGQYI